MQKNNNADPISSYLLSGYTFLILAVMIWAGNSVVGRLALDENVPPLALAFWRWVLALFVFIALAGRQAWGLVPEMRANAGYLVSFSLVSVVGYNCTFFIALQKTTALQATLIQSILPVLVLLLGLLIVKTPVTMRQWLGVFFSISGSLIILIRGEFAVLQALEIREGDWWALAGVFVWAIQSFMIRWKPESIPILPFMTILVVIGLAVLTPLYIWETLTYKPMPVSKNSLLMVAYAGIIASVGGTTMWNEGTWRVGAAQAGYFGNLYPIFAGALAIIILGENPQWYHGVGALLVVIGIWLAIFDKRN